MKTAIRKHLPDFLAILGLLVVALVVSVYILDKQRLSLPAGVPVLGKDFFELEAEMTTAQAVTPGLESPTVSPLADPDWIAVRAMVPRHETNHVMDALYDIGARAILVTPIHAARI